MRTLVLLFSLLFLANCDQIMKSFQDQHTNRLTNETSPYLRQHANNPVDWYPWGDEALSRAKAENKPILLSIGYSSCHWCHVMAHESFENDTIAGIMNENFVNIKLDREERPDIDQIYMEAVQNMGLNGGWPLNVFLTPELKPFYGGTYFPPQNWKQLLTSVSEAYTNNFEKLSESADRFAESLQQSQASMLGINDGSNDAAISKDSLAKGYQGLKLKFDKVWGGIKKEPKFPMPSVWQYLADYSLFSGDSTASEHFLFTLDKIAAGGIYDQIGGGFSRYSVDGEWHVPHFEKMLYDNGQLMSLYATGYKIEKKPAYKRLLLRTARWLKDEMLDENGGFYSALDADSEGEEGKFYTWSFEEAKEIAGSDFSLISEYYDISKEGNWEEKNVLRRLEQDNKLAEDLNLIESELIEKVESFNEKALKVRNKRVHPGLDDKIIAGWNGLMLKGLSEAYQATSEEVFLELAKANASFIANEMMVGGSLIRIHGGQTKAFLEDYSAVIQSFITYYETTFDESYLEHAKTLTNYVIENFYDDSENFFYFTEGNSENLIARKKEIFDNVIPSSNSMMANNLYRLGIMLDNNTYQELSNTMLSKVAGLISQETEYLSNWGITALMMASETSEVLIVGKDYKAFGKELNQYFLPNKVIMAASQSSELPLFEFKEPLEGNTTIYVCYNKTCRLPVFRIQEALKEIKGAEYLL